MKKIIFMLSFLSFFSIPEAISQGKVFKSIYDFQVESLEGGTIDFKNFKGKKILIVNTASKCGLTPQYEALEKLYKLYKDKLVIIGFPANNFLAQEPGNNNEIKEFCTKNYGVSFIMASKISVKGKKMAPIYVWLTKKKYNKVLNSNVKWNFQKYLIAETGELLNMFPPNMDPLNEKITTAITN
jgi:glutathione peroxidase